MEQLFIINFYKKYLSKRKSPARQPGFSFALQFSVRGNKTKPKYYQQRGRFVFRGVTKRNTGVIIAI